MGKNRSPASPRPSATRRTTLSPPKVRSTSQEASSLPGLLLSGPLRGASGFFLSGPLRGASGFFLSGPLRGAWVTVTRTRNGEALRRTKKVRSPRSAGCIDHRRPVGSTPEYVPDSGATVETSTVPSSPARKVAYETHSRSSPSRVAARMVTGSPGGRPDAVKRKGSSTRAPGGSTWTTVPGEVSVCIATTMHYSPLRNLHPTDRPTVPDSALDAGIAVQPAGG